LPLDFIPKIIHTVTMKLLKSSCLLILLLNAFAAFSQDNDLPKIMYVISKDGLNQRSRPSTQSIKMGTYLYGERIIVRERGKSETIDGITNYWYKTYGGSGECWVFGGYLAERLPRDLPVVLGVWDDVDNSRQYYSFRPDHRYAEGYKETDMGIWGKWELNGNTLTLTLDSAMNYATIDPPDIVIVEVTIINGSNIILTWPNKERTKLTRCMDTW